MLKRTKSAFQYIKRISQQHGKVISDAKDEIRVHERGYGNATKPEDYLREFRDFIDTHLNEIAALKVICNKTPRFNKTILKRVKLILDRNHFNETMLNTAWKNMTNNDIAADIISFIRTTKYREDALISKRGKGFIML